MKPEHEMYSIWVGSEAKPRKTRLYWQEAILEASWLAKHENNCIEIRNGYTGAIAYTMYPDNF